MGIHTHKRVYTYPPHIHTHTEDHFHIWKLYSHMSASNLCLAMILFIFVYVFASCMNMMCMYVHACSCVWEWGVPQHTYGGQRTTSGARPQGFSLFTGPRHSGLPLTPPSISLVWHLPLRWLQLMCPYSKVQFFAELFMGFMCSCGHSPRPTTRSYSFTYPSPSH